jgi:DMSO/TMAO reductase YedYZ molybdopterin-dependent catalytic subunit
LEATVLKKLARREFLSSGARMVGGVALAAAGLPTLSESGWVDALALADQGQQEVVPGKEKLIVRSLKYMDLETPASLLQSWITPTNSFFVRTHLPTPLRANLHEWRLKVSGEVEKPLSLSMADLQRMVQKTVVTVLECAGNGRSFYRPRVPGIQWERGAVGNAQFAGPMLSEILGRAGVKPSGKHIAFNGLDAPPGKVPDFIRSIPVEKAMHADTLIALKMNGAPLRLEHGYPARVIPPGWVGAAAVKWLEEITVLPQEFVGNFMKPGYRLPNHPLDPGGDLNPDDSSPITALPVKSIIASPADDAQAKIGPVKVSGVAWAGEEQITRVEISTDAGDSWHDANLGNDQAHYAWRLWDYNWTPPSEGTFTILARATDTAGRVQPSRPAWNPSGYLWNVIDRVQIHVHA